MRKLLLLAALILSVSLTAGCANGQKASAKGNIPFDKDAVTSVSETVEGVAGYTPENRYDLPQVVKQLPDVNLTADGAVRLAEVEGNPQIALYGIGGETEAKVLLQWGDSVQCFDWNYVTTRMINPRMFLVDVDSDNEMELVVVLYIGSGTGVSVEQLHIIECKDGNMTDFCLPDTIYREKLSNGFKFKKYEESYTVSIGNLMMNVPGDEETLENCRDNVYVGNQVFFIYNQEFGTLQAVFKIEVESNIPGIPFYPGSLYVNVTCNDGVFTLERFAIQQE